MLSGNTIVLHLVCSKASVSSSIAAWGSSLIRASEKFRKNLWAVAGPAAAATTPAFAGAATTRLSYMNFDDILLHLLYVVLLFRYSYFYHH